MSVTQEAIGSLRRGEVIRVNLNPTQGREQMGEARPCLVLSQTVFNAARGKNGGAANAPYGLWAGIKARLEWKLFWMFDNF